VEAGTQSRVLRLVQPTLGAAVCTEPTHQTRVLGLLEALMLGQSQMMWLKLVHGNTPGQ
jgi:hypothetical protein